MKYYTDGEVEEIKGIQMSRYKCLNTLLFAGKQVIMSKRINYRYQLIN
jgi:hypothetical protein